MSLIRHPRGLAKQDINDGGGPQGQPLCGLSLLDPRCLSLPAAGRGDDVLRLFKRQSGVQPPAARFAGIFR